MAVASTESWEETVAPASEIPEIKLFGKWASEDVQVSDISLTVSTHWPAVHRWMIED